MKRIVAGALDTDALARLHFTTLSHAERCAAIHRLAATGHGPDTIARATGMAVEAVQSVLAERAG